MDLRPLRDVGARRVMVAREVSRSEIRPDLYSLRSRTLRPPRARDRWRQQRSEFFGAMLAARELMFLRDLLVDLGVDLDGPTTVFTDSKSAVDMAYDPIAFKNTKHIMRAAFFLRDLVAKLAVAMKHLSGDRMIADILTKATARPVFLELLLMYNRGTPVL